MSPLRKCAFGGCQLTCIVLEVSATQCTFSGGPSGAEIVIVILLLRDMVVDLD